MPVPSPYIFISHSTKDNIFAHDLSGGLREAGFNVWLDLDSIREVRNTWQFFRDRRPETYGELMDL